MEVRYREGAWVSEAASAGNFRSHRYGAQQTVVVVAPATIVPTGFPPLGGQVALLDTETMMEPPTAPSVQVPSLVTVKGGLLVHALSVYTVVVAVHWALGAPQAQPVQSRVSIGVPEKVCRSAKPCGQGKSFLPPETQRPATKGGAGLGAQIWPPGQPPPRPPPVHG